MKFSLFYEMQIAGPTRQTEAQLFHDCVEQVELADQIGYDGIWEVEHHGLYEYSHSSAPEVFLSFVAARTKHVRLGHGITLTPCRYNHPIRIAERIATLDILSNGRVNWGSGKSSSLVEQVAFELDRTTLHSQWFEALEMIPRMWQEGTFQWKGRFFNIEPMQVVPKPVQRPHPPIFAACSKPDSAIEIGKLGVGALNFAAGNDQYMKRKCAEYKKAAAAAQPTAFQKNIHFACTPASLVLSDDKRACRHGFRGARFFWESLSRYFLQGDLPTGPIDVPRDFLPEAEMNEMIAFRNKEGSTMTAVIGDPAAAIESVSRFKDAGVDELILVMQMGTVPHELVMESIRTFGEKVLPHFK